MRTHEWGRRLGALLLALSLGVELAALPAGAAQAAADGPMRSGGRLSRLHTKGSVWPAGLETAVQRALPRGVVLQRQAAAGSAVWRRQAELTAADSAQYDYFGSAVSVDGDTAVVGAKFATPAAPTGLAYVFVRHGATWSQQARLTAADGGNGDSFGMSVAVSGDTILIGAPGHHILGAAYVFVRTGPTWRQQAELSAPPSTGPFGWSVSLSGDTALVGLNGGGAYVFVRQGTTWRRQAVLTDDATGDYFGSAMALAGDTAVIGAWGAAHATGAAYVFVRTGTTWHRQATLTAADGVPGDQFGFSVAIDGETAVIGAWYKNKLTGAAYVFTRQGTTWRQQAELTAADGRPGDALGDSVALSGSTAVVGAYQARHGTGAAYVFAGSGSAWRQQARLTAADGAPGGEFGYAVALSGATAVTTAMFQNVSTGAAYVFVRGENVADPSSAASVHGF